VSQRNIDFGTFPDDPSADPIRTAFAKTQENFTELFNNQISSGVSSINKTPGAGITVNRPTGDVVISANIACVKITSANLNLTLDGQPNSLVTLTRSSQVIGIDLPGNLITSNITASLYLRGNIVEANNLTVSNSLVSNSLEILGNTILSNLIADDAQFTNISGNGAGITGVIAVTAQTVTNAAQPNITSVGILTSLDVTGNVTANYFIGNGSLLTGIDASKIQNGNSNISVLANSNIVFTVSGNANVVTVTDTGLVIDNGTGGSFTGANLISANFISASANITANNFIGNFSGNVTSPGSNTQVIFNNEGLLSASQNLTFDNASNLLFVNGSISVTSNASVGNLETQGQAQVGGSLSVGTGAGGNISGANIISANTINVAIITASGNANVGNIGAINGVFTNIFGNGAGITDVQAGNITGQVANALVAGTVYTNAQPNITSVGNLTSLVVTGNAEVGNLYTLGQAQIDGNLTLGTGLGGNLSGANVISANTINTNILSGTGNANVGNIGAINGVFTNIFGNGAGITDIQAGNITGIVANANYANFSGNAVNSENVDGYIKVPFNYNDISPKNVATIPANAVVSEVLMVITTAFDDVNSTISLGTVADANLLLNASDSKPNIIGTYASMPGQLFPSETWVVLTIEPGSSTTGSGMIVIYF
jgi:hypothetical protein